MCLLFQFFKVSFIIVFFCLTYFYIIIFSLNSLLLLSLVYLLWNWCFIVFITWWPEDFRIFVLLSFGNKFVLWLLSLTAVVYENSAFSVVWSSRVDYSFLGEYCWLCLGPYFRWLDFFSFVVSWSNLWCFDWNLLCFVLLEMCCSREWFSDFFYVFDFSFQFGDCFIAECYNIFHKS